MGKLKPWIVMLLGFGTPTAAFAGPYPWPWPWAVECKMEWDDVIGVHTLSNVAEPGQLTIRVLRAPSSSRMILHIERTDRNGEIHSQGVASAHAFRKRAIVYMQPGRKGGVKPYSIHISRYRFQETAADQASKCSPGSLAMVAVVKSDVDAKDNYTILRPSPLK